MGFAQRVKKASQSLRLASRKCSSIVFFGGVYVEKNSLRGVECRMGHLWWPTEARNAAKPVVKKGLSPFFDSLCKTMGFAGVFWVLFAAVGKKYPAGGSSRGLRITALGYRPTRKDLLY